MCTASFKFVMIPTSPWIKQHDPSNEFTSNFIVMSCQSRAQDFRMEGFKCGSGKGRGDFVWDGNLMWVIGVCGTEKSLRGVGRILISLFFGMGDFIIVGLGLRA